MSGNKILTNGNPTNDVYTEGKQQLKTPSNEGKMKYSRKQVKLTKQIVFLYAQLEWIFFSDDNVYTMWITMYITNEDNIL